MADLSFSDEIAAIDAAIATLKAQLVDESQPVGVQSLSVAGRNIFYTDPAEALEKLLAMKLKLEAFQRRNTRAGNMFSRTRITGLGTER